MLNRRSFLAAITAVAVGLAGRVKGAVSATSFSGSGSGLTPIPVSVGDGATDDADALQAYIDIAEASDGILKLPSGTYFIRKPLVITSPPMRRVDLSGVVITGPHDNLLPFLLHFRGSGNCIVSGGTLAYAFTPIGRE